MIEILKKYMNIPFGNELDGGMDCFVFAKHFRKEEFGRSTPLSIPCIRHCKDDLQKAFADGISQDLYEETPEPIDGDLALMSAEGFGKWHHLGIYLEGGIIHCSHNHNASGVTFASVQANKRIYPDIVFYTEK